MGKKKNNIFANNNDDQSRDVNQDTKLTKDSDKKRIKIFKYKFHKKKLYIVIGCVCVISGIMYFTSKRYDNIVYPNIKLYDENISSLNESELEGKIYSTIEFIKNNKFAVNVENKSYDIRVGDFISDFNEDKLKNDIMSFGKNKNFISQFGLISLGVKRNYNFNIKVNYDEIKNKVDEIYEDNLMPAVEPGIDIEGDSISVEEGKVGKGINKEELSNEIMGLINSLNIRESNIVISQNYNEIKPSIDINDLKTVDAKISSATTYFGGTGYGRGLNIVNAASKINNTILMPGEEFSYEDAVSPVTFANGYHVAPVIVNGMHVDGVGGGVCQVSTTLYNTQLKAGILPTERYNHSKSVSYVQKGLDATLATGSKNYRFKNTYDYPILIHAYTVGGQITVEFWSNESVTKGIEYVPVSFVKGNVANTYLYGYNNKKELIYKKFIDTSIYG